MVRWALRLIKFEAVPDYKPGGQMGLWTMTGMATGIGFHQPPPQVNAVTPNPLVIYLNNQLMKFIISYLS